MRFVPLILFLCGCASLPFTTLDGTWRGPQTLVLNGSQYEFNGELSRYAANGGYFPAEIGHFASDAQKLYFTPSAKPRTAMQVGTTACTYRLAGDVLTVRDCGYAGQYQR